MPSIRKIKVLSSCISKFFYIRIKKSNITTSQSNLMQRKNSKSLSLSNLLNVTNWIKKTQCWWWLNISLPYNFGLTVFVPQHMPLLYLPCAQQQSSFNFTWLAILLTHSALFYRMWIIILRYVTVFRVALWHQ